MHPSDCPSQEKWHELGHLPKGDTFFEADGIATKKEKNKDYDMFKATDEDKFMFLLQMLDFLQSVSSEGKMKRLWEMRTLFPAQSFLTLLRVKNYHNIINQINQSMYLMVSVRLARKLVYRYATKKNMEKKIKAF